MIAAPFRHESDTSREAAVTLATGEALRNLALRLLKAKGAEGATIDEVSVYLSEQTRRQIPPGTASARMGELVKADLASKTPMRRKTRAGKNAVVYLAGSWKDYVDPKPPESQLERYKTKLAHTGHGHVVARHDGHKQGCGGVVVCKICRTEQSYFAAMEEK